MNEDLQRKLLRQIKLLNFWLTLFGTLLLTGLIIVGFMLWQLLTFVSQAKTQLDSLQTQAKEATDLRAQLCGEKGFVGAFVRDSTEICKK